MLEIYAHGHKDLLFLTYLNQLQPNVCCLCTALHTVLREPRGAVAIVFLNYETWGDVAARWIRGTAKQWRGVRVAGKQYKRRSDAKIRESGNIYASGSHRI